MNVPFPRILTYLNEKNVPFQDLLEPVCCKKWQNKSQPRNWFGGKGISEGYERYKKASSNLGTHNCNFKNDRGIHFFIFCSSSINHVTAKLGMFSAPCIQNKFWSSVRRHQRRKNSRWKRSEINDTMNLLAHFYACTILLKRIQL